MTDEQIEALIAKWRMKAMVSVQFSLDMGDTYTAGVAEAYGTCADELEAAATGTARRGGGLTTGAP